MNTSNRRLIQACGLIALCAAPLYLNAQEPAPAAAAATPAPPTAEEGSYLIGVNFGQSLRQFGVTNEVSLDTIIRGLKDGMAGKKVEVADQRRLQEYVHGVMDGVAKRNAEAGKEFLEKNGHEKGVKTTASGMQYKIIAAGDAKAASPAPTDQVSVQYRGKLLDGTEFDSSYSRGVPATFGVNGVIKGWQEALGLMKPGAKWQVWIPADLGYGMNPRPGIPGGSLLAFDIELISVKPAPAAAATPPTP